METRIIICGGRDFNDKALLKTNLDSILSEFENVRIVSGHARGADMLGEFYAKDNNISLSVFPAEWNKYGKSAGYRRNEEMLAFAKQAKPVVIAFWDGKSRGTKHMIETSKRAGVDVRTVNY